MVPFLLAEWRAMGNGLRRWMVVLAVLVALTARAQAPFSAAAPEVLPHAAHGLFTGDEWRYRRDRLVSGFALRLVADLISMPTGAPWWTPGEWGLFAGVVGSTVALSVSPRSGEASADVRFQRFLTFELLGEHHFRIWGPIGDPIIWSSVGVAMLVTLIYGLVTGDALAPELVALSLEAALVAQLYHQMIKLLTGRAGPQRPELMGNYYGPVDGIWLWPEGTPSGHMATMYAMLSVVMNLVDHPALWVGLNAFALVFGASLVGDTYHWLSEVTFGAAIGYCVGRWVVRHRSTHYVYGVDEQPLVQLDVLPLLLPGNGAAGVVLAGTF